MTKLTICLFVLSVICWRHSSIDVKGARFSCSSYCCRSFVAMSILCCRLLLSSVIATRIDNSNYYISSKKSERLLHRYLNAANILQKATVPTFCTDGNLTPQFSYKNSSSISNASEKVDVFCQKSGCSEHSFCFMGSCACHPGYTSISKCLNRSYPVAASNPWYCTAPQCTALYTSDCPNLSQAVGSTINVNTPLNQLGGEHRMNINNNSSSTRTSGNNKQLPQTTNPVCKMAAGVGLHYEHKFCAYLCYAHPSYGVAVVPKSLWRAAQEAEGDLWRSISASSQQFNDRAEEHWAAFSFFPKTLLGDRSSLGRVIEVGAGPWTQLKGLLHVRPDLLVESFTVWEPSAKRYMEEVPSCSYRSGSTLLQWGSTQAAHSFPVVIESNAGELLAKDTVAVNEYDTLLSINVLEHVQDAFRYLTSLYLSLKSGGRLIFHERYYNTLTLPDGDLYHPVRVTRPVLDKFLSGFHVLFNNCSASYDNRLNERGYYVIATKK